MSKNDKKMRTSTELNESEVMDMIVNNNTEEMITFSTRTLKPTSIKKNKFFNNGKPINLNDSDDYIPINTRFRSNSVDLYKKHNREKKLKKMKENNINSIDNIIINKNDKIIENNVNNNNQKDGKKNKKVSFLNPLVIIIDVESYKKFNEENTCKDPFDDIINNNNNNNNNNVNNKAKKNNENEKVVCSCLII